MTNGRSDTVGRDLRQLDMMANRSGRGDAIGRRE